MQFLAILKDSYREAVDGFIIYLMLGLGTLMILLVGSISYEPEPPNEALPEVLKQFNFVFPNRSKSQQPVNLPVLLDYKAKDASELTDGSVKFTLTVEFNPDVFKPKIDEKKDKDKGKDNEKEKEKDNEKEKNKLKFLVPDMFRSAVAAWKLPAGEKIKENPLKARAKKLNSEKQVEIVKPPNMTPQEWEKNLADVTDEDMTAFLKSQCSLYLGVSESDVTVTRKKTVTEPDYEFDVALKSVAGARGWPHRVKVLFKAFEIPNIPLGFSLFYIQDTIVNGLASAGALVLCVIITGFFIPNMLRKGSLDLLISKPIGRVQLLVYKYIGGLILVFLVSTFTIGGVWLVMSARSGYWDPGFLVTIPAMTFTFAVIYAVSTCVAVLTRSSIAAILVSIAFMFLMWLVGLAKSFMDITKVTEDIKLPDWSYTLVDLLNNCLPRYKDLDKLTTKVTADTNLPEGLARLIGVIVEFPSFGATVGVSLLFIVIMLGLASWRLAKRDG
jgi:ABC-type transport system involved in multi-copper enzyme maturation permease subunit